MRMHPSLTRIGRLLHDEAGQDLIEYALLAGLVGLSAIASMRALAAQISAAFASAQAKFTAATA